jgi:hypothetical protein
VEKSKQSNGKSKQSNGKSKQSNGKDFISSKMANQRIYNLRIVARSFVKKPLARNDRFCFQNSK